MIANERAKIFKISGYLIVPDGYAEADDIKYCLEYGLLGDGRLVAFGRHIHVEESTIDNYDKNHELNVPNCDLYDCEKYFKGNKDYPSDFSRNVSAGQKYRHFKGKVVEVVLVSQDSEMPGSYVVVYKDEDGDIWHRPLSMFLSEVDHEKYPNVTQKYRFELVEE